MGLLRKLHRKEVLSKAEWIDLLEHRNQEITQELFALAGDIRRRQFGNEIYIRGLIELTNYCRNNCRYCGIRRDNQQAQRYRLSREEILDCCQQGYSLGFRTFVLQGGEDAYFTDQEMEKLIRSIKTQHPDCALTLSLGERSRESYQRMHQAGADRYLLRHETANVEHYSKLHPPELSLEHRMKCLYDLKELGYQTGTGFMVGSPGQTNECLAEDLLFIQEFQPHMVGIGPFVPHHQTPFAEEPQGSLELTLYLLGLLRVMKPNVMLPATTALGTIHPQGRELGVLAGANVVMPNLSPQGVRKKYELYDNKICTGAEAAECLETLEAQMKQIGCTLSRSRGDYKEEVTCTI